MTIQYIEKLGSRSLSRQKNSYTASRLFLVYDDSTAYLSLEDAVNFSGGVTFSETHPDINGIFANGFSVTASQARKDTWEITWTYAEPTDETDAGGDDDDFDDDGDNTEIDPEDGGELEPPDGGDGGGSDSTDVVGDEGVGEAEPDASSIERLYTGVSITTGIALVDGFVAGASIPSLGSQGGSDGYLITNGTIVHQGGDPVTIPVPITEITLSITQGGEFFFLNGVQNQAGKRNSGAFYGFAAGSAIFKGISVQRQSINSWDVNYNFTWDAWSHMRQVPKRDSDGKAEWNDDDPQTLDIYYKQPFPDTTSFSFSP